MGLLRRRLHPRPHVLDFAARRFREPLEFDEFLVALLVKSDDGRSTVVGVDYWTLTRLRWGGDEGRVVEFAPHFDLKKVTGLDGCGRPCDE